MTEINPKIRVRIAPSPTGNLHLGTAHTALFNFLFAKHMGGIFVLRIEDTDLERSDKAYEKNIFDGLRWLGLTADESPEVGGPYAPYRQSERLDTYEKYVKQLLEADLAYRCFCTKEELDAERKEAQKNGAPLKYSGKCRARNEKSGGNVIRFKIPEEKITFHDLIRGEISFDGSLIGDIAIAKDPRAPLYNFAVVVDDFEMKISHVIRGEDHVANTPKQIFLQRALGFTTPVYAHLPLILDKDRAKLSKRYSAVSVDEYRRDGYLPQALTNFLALLGWHPKDDREVMPLEDIARDFSIERVQKGGAVFDIEKLQWINAQYIKKLGVRELAALCRELYPELENRIAAVGESRFKKIVAQSQDRLRTLKDFIEESKLFFEIEPYEASLLVWKKSTAAAARESLAAVGESLKTLRDADFESRSALEGVVKPLGQKYGTGDVFWPLRVALSGKDASPGPIELMEALGKEESLKRIHDAIQKLD